MSQKKQPRSLTLESKTLVSSIWEQESSVSMARNWSR
jgi:hypothetical protein